MAIKLTTKLLGGPTTHYEPNSIPCDDDGGDFQFHNWDKRMANVIILCEGVTTIECLLDSRDGLPHPGVTKKSPKTGNDPIVSFCYARNLYPPTSASAASCATDDFKERPGCEWTAYCKPVGDYARQGANPDALMMRGFGTHFSHFRSGNLKISNESGPLIAELSASEASEAGADDPNPKLYYMAHGDCGGAWNPGHCSADPLNLSVVQKLLGADRTNTVAYLMRGLNYDDLANTDGSPDRPLFKLWEALASRTYSRKTAYDNFPRGGKPVSLVAFSPSPASSIWWGGNQCKAVHLSAVWFNFRSRIENYMDIQANSNFDVNFFKTHCLLKNNIPDAVDNLGSSQLDGLILIAARTGRRQIKNKVEMYEAIKKELPFAKVAMIEFTSSITYAMQYGLWRRSQIVIGLHGGNLGGAAFLSPGQGLIEGGFDCMVEKPPMFAVTAVSNGAMWRCASVTNCPGDCMETGGTIVIDQVVSHLKEMLNI